MTTAADPIELAREKWLAAWPEALAIWSRFTKLREPNLCLTTEVAKKEGLTDSFAMIRLTDQAVVVNVEEVVENGIEDFPLEVLAHEIGHHVYVPGSLLEHGRMLARVRRGLPQREDYAPLVANLYADLLINDRLQRQAGLDIAGVYRAITHGSSNRFWTLYLRIYEILWGRQRGSLAAGKFDDVLEGD
ncbi:MAG TPA: hypothetical protein VKE74_07315, partial [Gemmataceae bacterium]|nr:hypothetical protein [Gemmataceae bacterium]